MDIMLSALQHYVFCPRQCALIHLEQIWQENGLTAAGRLMHDTAHSRSSRMRDGVKIVADLELRSDRLGLHGRADIVEFHRSEIGWKPYPVEYKKGRLHKNNGADDVQLCAQALCLEEMLGVEISEGALFYGEARRRCTVRFDEALREYTKSIASAVRTLLESGRTPLPQKIPGCDSCSLCEWCLPELCENSALYYVQTVCEGQL